MTQLRPFRQVDVFTDEALLGNPVAWSRPRGLATDRMRRSRSERTCRATFVGPPAPRRRLPRIFCAERELPFAGHPTLGSCHAWLRRWQAEGQIIVQVRRGLVRIRRDGALLPRGTGTAALGAARRRGRRRASARTGRGRSTSSPTSGSD
jgi:PhzF family phenazine biosynthesis protein